MGILFITNLLFNATRANLYDVYLVGGRNSQTLCLEICLRLTRPYTIQIVHIRSIYEPLCTQITSSKQVYVINDDGFLLTFWVTPPLHEYWKLHV